MEVLDYGRWRVHRNVAASVDALLADQTPRTELRSMRGNKMVIRFEGGPEVPTQPPSKEAKWAPGVAPNSWLGDLCKMAQAWGLGK